MSTYGSYPGDNEQTNVYMLPQDATVVHQLPKHAVEPQEQFAEFVGQYFGIRVLTRTGRMYVSRKMPMSLLPEKRAKFEDEISAGDDVTFVVIKTPEGEAYIRIAAIESWTFFSWEMVKNTGA